MSENIKTQINKDLIDFIEFACNLKMNEKDLRSKSQFVNKKWTVKEGNTFNKCDLTRAEDIVCSKYLRLNEKAIPLTEATAMLQTYITEKVKVIDMAIQMASKNTSDYNMVGKISDIAQNMQLAEDFNQKDKDLCRYFFYYSNYSTGEIAYYIKPDLDEEIYKRINIGVNGLVTYNNLEDADGNGYVMDILNKEFKQNIYTTNDNLKELIRSGDYQDIQKYNEAVEKATTKTLPLKLILELMCIQKIEQVDEDNPKIRYLTSFRMVPRMNRLTQKITLKQYLDMIFKTEHRKILTKLSKQPVSYSTIKGEPTLVYRDIEVIKALPMPNPIDIPNTVEYLSKVPQAQVEDFLKYLWAIVDSSSKTRQALFLADNGQTGKSAINTALAKYLGNDLVKPLTINNKTGDNALADVYKARLITVPENDNVSIVSNKLFKSITGSDAVTVKKLYQNPFSTTIEAKMIILSNCIPKIDITRASEKSRAIVIKMQPNKELSKKLKGGDADFPNRLAKEMPQLLRLAWEYYKKDSSAVSGNNLTLSEETISIIENVNSENSRSYLGMFLKNYMIPTTDKTKFIKPSELKIPVVKYLQENSLDKQSAKYAWDNFLNFINMQNITIKVVKINKTKTARCLVQTDSEGETNGFEFDKKQFMIDSNERTMEDAEYGTNFYSSGASKNFAPIENINPLAHISESNKNLGDYE